MGTELAPAGIEDVLASLAATPQRLASASEGVDATRLHARTAEDEWSPNDILAHLRASADVWGKSIMAMIAQDHPTLRYVSPRTWIRKTSYPEQEYQASPAAFARQRAELLRSLEALDLDGWSRGATFTGTTRGREHTVYSYARRIVQHEEEHWAQIEALLGNART